MVRRVAEGRMSAAERRIRELAPGTATLREAVRATVERLARGVECPPTDLAALGQRLGVREISYERFPGSGELKKTGDGYYIICSVDEPRARQRFTVAHELAHVILEGTGRNAPRTGKSVERVCDMLASECLMPAAVFEPLVSAAPTLEEVARLSRRFETSLTATAIRCAQCRTICVFEIKGEHVTWGYGGIRPGAIRTLPDQVRDGVVAVMTGEKPAEHVYFYGNGVRSSRRRFESIYMGDDRALFMLTQENESRKWVAVDSVASSDYS